MQLQAAKKIALKYLELLKPYCERIEIAGSIRREKPEVGDIELVCIPKKVEIDDPACWFKKIEIIHPEFCKIIDSLERIRGNATGKAMQRNTPEGIVLDIFTATPDNWGYIFAIRTGPDNFSHKVLANNWVKYGYHGKDGMLYNKQEKPVPVKEESDLFLLIGIEYIDPKFRMNFGG